MLERFKKYVRSVILKTVRAEWTEINRLNNKLTNTTVGKNVKLYPIYKISNCSIGDYTYISESAMISDTTIGKFCSIGPNFLCGWGIHPLNGISTSPMFYSSRKQNGMTLSAENKIEERKSITIGNDVFIGMNVSILDGVTIGDGAVIGAGAVVNKDVPPYAIVGGSPIKLIKYRFEEELIHQFLQIKWWDWPEEKLKIVENRFFDVNDFVQEYQKSLK